MAEWWYRTIYKCTECGAKYYEFDWTAPWYDSGLSGSPTVETLCEQCAEDLKESEDLPSARE